MSDGQPVIIQELTLPFATLVLAGKDRPNRRLGVATRQRGPQRHLPGADSAVVHVMGHAEEPMELVGKFYDDFARLFGQSPKDQVQQARGLLMRLNRCRLTWGDTIIRVGRVKQVNAQYVRHTVIPYTIVFEVDQAEEPRTVVRPSPGFTVAQNIISGINTVLDIATDVSAVANFALGTANTIIGG